MDVSPRQPAIGPPCSASPQLLPFASSGARSSAESSVLSETREMLATGASPSTVTRRVGVSNTQFVPGAVWFAMTLRNGGGCGCGRRRDTGVKLPVGAPRGMVVTRRIPSATDRTRRVVPSLYVVSQDEEVANARLAHNTATAVHIDRLFCRIMCWKQQRVLVVTMGVEG